MLDRVNLVGRTRSRFCVSDFSPYINRYTNSDSIEEFDCGSVFSNVLWSVFETVFEKEYTR